MSPIGLDGDNSQAPKFDYVDGMFLAFCAILAIIIAASMVWGCAGPKVKERKGVVIEWACWDVDDLGEMSGQATTDRDSTAEIYLPARVTPRSEPPICVAVPQQEVPERLVVTTTKEKIWVEVR